jgi:hypothetical protein
VNWCTRYSPLVSLPRAPASALNAFPTPTTRFGSQGEDGMGDAEMERMRRVQTEIVKGLGLSVR